MSFETAVGNCVVDDNIEIFYPFAIKTTVHLNSCNEVIVSFYGEIGNNITELPSILHLFEV